MGLEKLALMGIALIIMGMLLLVISIFTASDARTGGVVLIGPIPLIFGNDKRLIYFSLAFAAFVFVTWILARKWLK